MKINRKIALLASVGTLAVGFAALSNMDKVGAQPYLKTPIQVTPGGLAAALSNSRMTRFDPTIHGFIFKNTFLNVTGAFDITTSGLCGGMVYTALDYFKNTRPIPNQNYTPVSGTSLEKHIYARQMTSLGDHMDKWLELHNNPFGARNSEFFNWGLQGFGGGRLQELKAKIDAGEPVPLGLKSMSANPGEDHVVLAIGYDMGRYKGDLGANKEDLKIFIYDPNHGNEKITLVPRVNEQAWCEVEYVRKSDGKPFCWRSYFVQQNYRMTNPPNIPARQNELIMHVTTGGDDLRGGGDNLNVKIMRRSGPPITATNVNLSKRWIDYSENIIGVTLPPGLNRGDITSVELGTAFRGGFDGDNWNVNKLVIKQIANGAEVANCTREGAPLVRLTGSYHNYGTAFPC